MNELLKILKAIKQHPHDNETGKIIQRFLQKARSSGLSTYAACKILESHLVSGSSSYIASGTEGWIAEGGETEEVIDPDNSDIEFILEPNQGKDIKVTQADSREQGEIQSQTLNEYSNRFKPLYFIAVISLSISALIFALSIEPVRSSILWSFPSLGHVIYKDYPPDNPRLISPSDGESGLPTLVKLNWECNDPDRDHLKFDIYFGISGSELKLEYSGWTSKSFIMDGLRYGEGYSWQVIAKDANGLTAKGEIWNFSTKPEIGGIVKTTLDNAHSDDPEQNEQKEVIMYVVPDTDINTADHLLNIRTGPGPNYPVIDRLESGEVIKLLQDRLGDDKLWCRIYCPSRKITGYVTENCLHKM